MNTQSHILAPRPLKKSFIKNDINFAPCLKLSNENRIINKENFKQCQSKRTQLPKLLQNQKLKPKQIAKSANQENHSISQEKLYLIKFS